MDIKEITALEAFEILNTNHNSALIDVRCEAEFNFTGLANLEKTNKNLILLPWRNYPEMAIDSQFKNKLTNILHDKSLDQESDLLFICRSGARSREAAYLIAKSGYNCYNISDGFEGDLDQNNHRGNKNGWKANNLPWRQS